MTFELLQNGTHLLYSHIIYTDIGIQRQLFQRIVTFSQAHLQIALLSLFLQKSAQLYYIHLTTAIEPLLLGTESLGAHTNLVIFSPDGHVKKYVWTHDVDRPFGEDPPFQCSCGTFKSFRLVAEESNKNQITLQCRYHDCKKKIVFCAVKGIEWINRTHTKRDQQGLWFSQILY